MCAGLTAADLALHLRVDASVFAVELDRALQAACMDAAQITGAIIPEPPDEQAPRWQTALLIHAARLFSRRESPLGIAGGIGDLPVSVRAIDPDTEALFTRLTTRAGLG